MFRIVNQKQKKLNLNQNKNPFGRMFARIIKEQTDTEEITLIDRMKFINMLSVSPSYFHAVIQKLSNCPKVYKRVHRLNYYKLSDVVTFIETIKPSK